MPTSRVGAIGLGRRALTHLTQLARTRGFTLVAGADPWDQARAYTAERFGLRNYESASQMLRRESPLDLVVVASRECDHERHVRQALQAGAHVFCEKPMALNPASARRMVKAARQVGRRLFMGFNLRYHPTVQAVGRFLASGRLGRIRSIWEWHDVDLNYFHNWMSVRARSGGLLFEKAGHDFDLINWMAGARCTQAAAFGVLDYYGGDKPNDLHCHECAEASRCPERVRRSAVYPPGAPHKATSPNAWQTLCAFRQEIDVCDNHVVNLCYDNGVTASYTEIHGSPVNARRFAVHGDQGRLEFEIHAGEMHFIPRRGGRARQWRVTPSKAGHGGADPAMWRDVLRRLRNDDDPQVSAEDGFRSVAVSHAAERSIRSRRVERVTEL